MTVFLEKNREEASKLGKYLWLKPLGCGCLETASRVPCCNRQPRLAPRGVLRHLRRGQAAHSPATFPGQWPRPVGELGQVQPVTPPEWELDLSVPDRTCLGLDNHSRLFPLTLSSFPLSFTVSDLPYGVKAICPHFLQVTNSPNKSLTSKTSPHISFLGDLN